MIEKWKLARCRDLKAEAERYNLKLKELQPSVSANMSAMPRGTKIGRPTEDTAIDIMNMEDLMRLIVHEHDNLTAEIIRACLPIESNQRQVILMYYVEGFEIQDIAEVLHYSVTWVKATRNKAIDTIAY